MTKHKMTATEVVKTAADILTQSESVFTKQSLLNVAVRLSQSIPDVTFNKIQNAISELTESKEFLYLETASMKGEGQIEYMTTQEMKEIETNIIKGGLLCQI